MKVLIIDNYDSFVYNIKQAVEALGHSVEMKENDRVKGIDVNEADAIIISPGPGNPKYTRDRGSTTEVLELGRKRVLGICFGHQLLATMLGCNVRRAESIKHGEIDTIRHFSSPLYRDVPEEFSAVRYHSLVIDPSASIIVDSIAKSDNSIMGFHTADNKTFGIQFHPESHFTEYGDRIIRNFLVG